MSAGNATGHPMPSMSPPEQGQLVQVRSRPWVVNEVKPSTSPTPAMQLPVATPQTLLTLSSVEDEGLGEELQIVWEIEPGAKLVEKVAGLAQEKWARGKAKYAYP